MSTLAFAGSFLVAGSFIGAGLLIILTGVAPRSPYPSWVTGASLLLVGLAIVLMRVAGKSGGLLMPIAGISGLGCMFLAAGLMIRYSFVKSQRK